MMGKMVFTIPEWAIPRWWRVAYLIIIDGIKEIAERIRVRPDERFNEVVTKHLKAYVEKGVMPPEDIGGAILNLADDYLAGREMNIRAGDYIAIQDHLRKNK